MKFITSILLALVVIVVVSAQLETCIKAGPKNTNSKCKVEGICSVQTFNGLRETVENCLAKFEVAETDCTPDAEDCTNFDEAPLQVASSNSKIIHSKLSNLLLVKFLCCFSFFIFSFWK